MLLAYAETDNRKMAVEAYEKLIEVWAGREAFEEFKEARRYVDGC